LLRGVRIDDGDGSRPAGPARGLPFGDQHLHRALLETVCGSGRGDGVAAARERGLSQRGGEQPAAGVGVDLDQLRARLRKVEVEAEEGAAGAAVVARYLRRPREHRVAIRAKRHGCLHRAHRRGHPACVRRACKDRRMREQMRMAGRQIGGQAREFQPLLHGRPQGGHLDRQAAAAGIQRRRGLIGSLVTMHGMRSA
jgi:hypothetical protein